jgi:TetR/AcrR family transcriptional regulator
MRPSADTDLRRRSPSPPPGRHTRAIIDAARRLIAKQGEFTTQELVSEAGVALQTFYRHFGGKDQLLVAVLQDMVAEQSAAMAAAAGSLADPVSRLHYYVNVVLRSLGNVSSSVGAQYVTAQHWRLHQMFPDEVAAADRPFFEIVRAEVIAATDAGLLSPSDPDQDTWLMLLAVRSVYHHYAFAALDRPPEEIIEHLWTFFLGGLRGRPAEATPATSRPITAPRPSTKSLQPIKPTKSTKTAKSAKSATSTKSRTSATGTSAK